MPKSINHQRMNEILVLEEEAKRYFPNTKIRIVRGKPDSDALAGQQFCNTDYESGMSESCMIFWRLSNIEGWLLVPTPNLFMGTEGTPLPATSRPIITKKMWSERKGINGVPLTTKTEYTLYTGEEVRPADSAVPEDGILMPSETVEPKKTDESKILILAMFVAIGVIAVLIDGCS